MLKHILTLLLLAAGITQAANYEISYLQERSDGKKVWRSLVLTPGTFLSVDSVTGQLQVRSVSQVRTDLSISAVENTALSTWAGSTNLTTLASGAARNNLSGGSGTLNLSLYTLTLPSDVSRLGSSIDLGTSEVTGTLSIANGGTGATSAAGGFANIKQPASTSATGVVQIATNTEVQAETDSLKAVVPSSLIAWWNAKWTSIKAAAQTIAGNWSFTGNVAVGDAGADTFQVAASNPTAANAYTIPSWPGAAGSPSAATLMTRDAVRYDVLDTSLVAFVEEFGTGGTTSGTVGQLGWNLSGTGSIENATGISNLPGGLHIRTTTMSSSLPVYAAYLGNTPGFRGGSFLGILSSAGEMRSVAVVGTLNVIDSVAWSYVLGKDGGGPTFDKITPPNSFGVRYIPYAGTAWAGTTVYSVGMNVRPVAANGYKYICTTAGTSASSEPTWPTTLKGTVVDGTVTWTCAGTNGDSNSKIQFFVSGANAETGTTVGTSTISGSTNARLTLRVRTTGTTAFFSVNGETEVPLTLPGGAFAAFPSFNVRNDTNAANPDLSIYTWRCISAGGAY